MSEHDPLQGTIFDNQTPKAPTKEEKKQQRQAQRELQRELRREAAPENRSGLIILGALVGLVLLVLVIGVIYMAINPQDMKAKDENKGEYIDSAMQAELSTDGIKGAVTRMYYTLEGSLAVFLDLGNGMTADQHPVSIYIELENEDGTVLGAGRSDNIPADFKVKSGERTAFLLYIAPEHVKVAEDDLDQIGYEITIQSEDAA